jgi:hypothetical protein
MSTRAIDLVAGLALTLGVLACEEHSKERAAPEGTLSLAPTSATADPSEGPDSSVQTTDCDRIFRERVSSSAIRSIGYCRQGHILEVEFIQRAVYRYYGVPERVHRAFMNARSHGRFMSYVIKPAGYRLQRVR